MKNPIAEYVQRQGVMVLDGGLATTLEARGHDLNDELWSAKVLLESPEAIRDVSMEFLAAGADCIATVTYQASLAGFEKRGLSEREGAELLRESVRIAVEARDAFWNEPHNREGRRRPLVAASIGPYGAFLADGSEYTGDYGIDEDQLYAFHYQRWHILAESDADLMACETIPSGPETSVLLRLLRETPDRWAWLSFSCGDESHLCDGSALMDIVRLCDAEERVAAIGMNCMAPESVTQMILVARSATEKPIIVYPNSGERYNVDGRVWEGAPDRIEWAEAAVEWSRLGAAAIGGCCRVGPNDIAEIRRRLVRTGGVE